MDQLMLAVRPAGQTNWVVIDPDTEPGARLAAVFGFTTSPKESVMSAAPMQTTTHHPKETPVHIVQESNQNKMSALLTARAKVATATTAVAAVPKQVWGWLNKTLHLGAVADFAKSLWGWAASKGAGAYLALGARGRVGAGLLLVSTDQGHAVLRTVVRPLVWAGRALDALAIWATNTIGVIEPHTYLDHGRSFVADRIAGVQIFMDDRVADTKRLWTTFVAPQFASSTQSMKVVSWIGTALLGYQILTLLGAAGFGFATMPVQIVAATAFVLVLSRPFRPLIGRLFGRSEQIVTEVRTAASAVADDVKDGAARTVEQVRGPGYLPKQRTYPARTGGKRGPRVTTVVQG